MVSIIIPVFNSEEYIADTLTSALSQTWANTEVIIVDDGSTDRSLNIARQFNDDRIRVFEQENKGASAARNKGLAEAKGDYIQFLDADDVLNNIKVEAQVRLLAGKEDAIATCATVNFFDDADPRGIQPVHDWYREGSMDTAAFLVKLYGGALIGPEYGGMLGVHAWLCPKPIIDLAGRWNEALTTDDDGEFFCRVVLAARQIVYAEEALCYYRKYTRAKSLSAVNDDRAKQSLLKATDLKAKYLLAKTSGRNAKLALARLYHENAVSFYPASLKLARESERKMKQLIPEFTIRPFKNGITGWLSKLISWKAVKILQYLKTRLLS